MNTRIFCSLAVLATLLFAPASARANIRLRVSVKFILDGAGQRASGNPTNDSTLIADDQVRAQIRRGNDILARAGAAYQLELVEIADVSGVSQWFNVDARDTGQRLQLQNAALVNTGLYKLRGDSINIYINGNGSSGNCAIAPPDQIILIGQGGRSTTIPHEIGHFFSLYHTQGRFCGGCSEPPAPGAPIIGNLCSSEPDNDEIGDTLPDLACWSQNQIAQRSFGRNYNALTAGESRQVDTVFFNLMSYHNDPRDRMTAGQIDRMTDSINGPRFHVASGRTVFVDRGNPCLRPEDLAEPFRTLAGYIPGWSWGTRSGLGVTLDPRNPPSPLPPAPCPPIGPCTLNLCLGGPWKNIPDAVNSAADGSRLQVRAGNYGGAITINKRLCIAADGGTVAIGRP